MAFERRLPGPITPTDAHAHSALPRTGAGEAFSFRVRRDPGIRVSGPLLWVASLAPTKEVLQLLKKEKYGFPANIELEYQITQDSTVIAEMKNCLA